MSEMHRLTLRLPLPKVQVSELELAEIKRAFRNDGVSLKVSAEDEYPVSDCWAEVEVLAAFLTGVAATHYLTHILNAFDKLVVAGVKTLGLGFRCGDDVAYREVPLDNRKVAIVEMERALQELKMGVEKHTGMIYWLEKSGVNTSGKLDIYSSTWIDGKNSSSLKTFTEGDADYGLWLWILTECNDSSIDGEELAKLSSSYTKSN